MKVAIRKMRQEGKKVGLVRVRWFRPFAAEDLAQCLSRFKAVGVIDRDFSLGSPYSGGVLATEVRTAFYPGAKRPPLIGFICGLGGREFWFPMWRRCRNCFRGRGRQGPAFDALDWSSRISFHFALNASGAGGR